MGFYTAATFMPDQSVGYLVRRCHQLAQVAMEPMFARHGLSGMQWSALISISLGAASTCAELAREISYDRGATTRLVDTLEAAGWLTRERASDDRRVVKLALTEEGADLAQRVKVDVIALWNEWLGAFDRDDLAGLIDQLQQLRDSLQAAAQTEEAAR